MDRRIFEGMIFCLIVLLGWHVHAADCWSTGQRIRQETSDCRYCPDPGLLQYCVVNYDFETGFQGWSLVDNNNPGLFWHADGYPGIIWTAPVPLSGNQSGWCGAGSAAMLVDGWKTPPGYADEWDQTLTSDPILLNGPGIGIEYALYIDTEPLNDYLVVEIRSIPLFPNWTRIDGPHSGKIGMTCIVPFPMQTTGTYQIRFRFISDCACSDEDGCFPSDGGAHIDDVTIRDATGIVEFEDFESAPPGATQMDGDANGIWWRAGCNAYGTYSGLVTNLQDRDPCHDDLSTQIVFFVGSPVPSMSYPGLFDTPFCLSTGAQADPCQDEMIVSPVIDLTRCSTNCDDTQNAAIPAVDLPKLGGAALEFTVYRDLPLSNLVFYYWRMRKCDLGGAPVEPWRGRGFIYYGGGEGNCYSEKDYLVSTHHFGDMYANNLIQVALGVIDMSSVFSPSYGTGLTHTPSPWFDDVTIRRYESSGPQWFYRSIDLFQDNFAVSGTVRADAAIDTDPIGTATINPRDWIGVTCGAPNSGGLGMNANGPMVFMNVRAIDISFRGRMPIVGPSLVGTYGTYVSFSGFWTVIQGALIATGCPNCRLQDVYAFDLNDQLFTPGYMIEYYFSAQDANGAWSYLPTDAPSLPNHPGTYDGRSNWFEFTCLPTGDSDILYVDDFHDRLSFDGEVQDNFDDAFMAVLPLTNQPDRYDVNGPSSLVSNSLESRAQLSDLLSSYRTIIWDSGNLRNGTICDGTTGDKSLDCQLLAAWLNQSLAEPCLWVLGDNVAYDLAVQASGVCPPMLMNTMCGVSFVSDSYFDVSWNVTPVVRTTPGSSIFTSLIDTSFCVYGGCPIINAYDCLDIHGTGQRSLEYPWVAMNNYYSAIHNTFINSSGSSVHTIWFGFSFMYTRGCEVNPQVKFKLLADAMAYFSQPVNPGITGDGEETPAYVTDLHQNYPNPFNPTTMIDFSLRERDWVTLRIYDVSGRLIKTLVEGTEEPGPHQTLWDGTNSLGRPVASGIYFSVMESGGFRETKKVVLVK